MEPCVIVVIAIVLVIIVLSIILCSKKCKKKPEKMKGSGLIIEPDKTIFKFSEEIFPIVSHEILNNEIIKKYSDVYQNFVKKTETKHSLEADDMLAKIRHFHIIFNEFIKYYNNRKYSNMSNLKDLYFSIVSNGLLDRYYYEKYIKIIDVAFSKNYKNINKQEFIDDIVELIEKTGNKIFINSSFIINKCKELQKFEKISSKRFNELLELIKHIRITKDDMIRFAKRITSTEFVNKAEYEKMLEMTRDEYITLSNEFLGDSVKFVHKGNVKQSTEKPTYMIAAERGLSKLFSDNDGEGREWIETGKNETYTDFEYKLNTSDNNHADIIPASVISVVVQIFIIIYVNNHSMEDIEKRDRINLLRFLEATRLNMMFISILSNTVENKLFNIKLSNSYIIEEN